MSAAAISKGSVDGIKLLDAKARKLPPALVKKYLERLELSQLNISIPDLALLGTLNSAHVDRICYETVGMHESANGDPPELSPLASAERVASKQARGGYCFLVGDAYAALLCTIGYKVSLHVGGVGDAPLAPERMGNHVVLIVHGLVDPERPGAKPCAYVADVGLGDGPSQPFRLANRRWTEDGFSYSLAPREHKGLWWFTHDPTGSFQGFAFSVATSCMSVREFQTYHDFYWLNAAESPYHRAGLVLQRRSPTLGALTMRNARLTRAHPSNRGAVETLGVATSQEEWFTLAREAFLLTGLDKLPVEAKARLWQVADVKHQQWLAEEFERARKRGLRIATVAASLVAAVFALAVWRAKRVSPTFGSSLFALGQRGLYSNPLVGGLQEALKKA